MTDEDEQRQIEIKLGDLWACFSHNEENQYITLVLKAPIREEYNCDPLIYCFTDKVTLYEPSKTWAQPVLLGRLD